jgi:hypothetical protein
MYGSRTDPNLEKEPPCETCRVEIMPENEEPFKIYMITRSQYIMGFNGPVDVNHLAVWESIDRYKVKAPIKVFERVTRCAKHIIYDMMEKNKQVDA